ncbi:hypothetical protein SLEP1_g33468 [Rubroshorea leprosula]|uniref:Trichome birefringence-like C-terminal domain-containing protein n=1 Tax=Rubroshorea leprosula TaxID=152421 RepID=A0AAV5KGR2_9ROSI|nr:hypothetical protein SLEP1_g33468 [Rubroshorea leprosula]
MCLNPYWRCEGDGLHEEEEEEDEGGEEDMRWKRKEGRFGDSLNRNMFVSLFCTLKRVSSEVKKWRPAGADRGFTFLQHNLTIAYHRTNLLVRYGGEVPDGTIKFFRTQSPRHFGGGDWNQGGSCQRLQPMLPQQVEELFSLKNNGTNVEARMVNEHLYKALEESNLHVLDITRMSEFGADAHPATAGGKKHDDCMHWCLPGITDTWNDLFVTHLNDLKIRN